MKYQELLDELDNINWTDSEAPHDLDIVIYKRQHYWCACGMDKFYASARSYNIVESRAIDIAVLLNYHSILSSSL